MPTALERTLLARGLAEQELERARAGAELVETSVTAHLVGSGVITENDLTDALVETFRLPAWDGRIAQDAARKIGKEPLLREIVIPVEQTGGRLVLAVADPARHEAHAALASAAKARHVDVVVAAETAITRAIHGAFPFEWPDDLVDELARYAGSERADWEGKLHARWASETSRDATEVRFANVLLLGLMATDATAFRIELTDAPRVLVRIGDVWKPNRALEGLALGSGLLRDAAARIVSMAMLESLRGDEWGALTLFVGRGFGCARSMAADVGAAEVPRGRVVYVERAFRRVRSEREQQMFDHRAAADEASAALRFADAHDRITRALAIAETQEHGTFDRMLFRGERAKLLALEGRLDASRAEYVSILEAPPVRGASIHRLHLMVSLVDDEHDAGRHESCETWATRAIELAWDLFGAPTVFTSVAMSLLGASQAQRGAVAEAEETLARLRAETRDLASGRRNVATLACEIALVTGAFADADRFATEGIEALTNDAMLDLPLHTIVLRFQARAARGLGDFARAASLLARALVIAKKHFAPSHPIIVAIERDLLDAKARHPYR